MGYEVNSENVKWARKRVDELYGTWVPIDAAVEMFHGIPETLRKIAENMADQPEANKIYSYADDFEKLANSLTSDFRSWTRDRRKLAAAIVKYERGVLANDLNS